jgi:hypothetical protein
MLDPGGMVKRSSKRDFAQNALRVVEIATGAPLKSKKNPAAVALGKLGGRKAVHQGRPSAEFLIKTQELSGLRALR